MIHKLSYYCDNGNVLALVFLFCVAIGETK